MSLEQELYELGSNLSFRLLNSSLFDKEVLIGLKPITVRSITGKAFSYPQSNSQEYVEAVYRHFEDVNSKVRTMTLLERNCHILRETFQLPKESVNLLALIVVNSLNPAFNELLETHQGLSDNVLHQLLSEALNVDYLTLKNTFESLAESGLWSSSIYGSEDMLQIHNGFAKALACKHAIDFSDLISNVVTISSKPDLKLSDFEHLDTDLPFAFSSGINDLPESGVNILLHGAAGVGKTQYAKLLVNQINANLYEVKAKGGDLSSPDDELDSRRSSTQLRLQYLKMAYRLFDSQRDAWLLIDECEDIFASFSLSTRISKDRLHQLLEVNTVPTIWITNHPESIPVSCLRRFSLVVELPNLPANGKFDMVSSCFKGLRLSKGFKEKLANSEAATPALLENAASLCKICNVKGAVAEEYTNTYLTEVLKLTNEPLETPVYKPELEFDPAYCNLKGDLHSLADITKTIERHPEARILLFGPPGTGKSAFVDYVCKENDLGLVTVKASDVLGKYVGESEGNIARLFEKASNEGKALLIDEADSLLTSREGATKSWEVSQVNELLMQIERFQSPLFIATNYFEALDKALLRRIDFKIELQALKHQQAISLFEEVVGVELDTDNKSLLSHMTNLTVGDFAILSRQLKFQEKRLTMEKLLWLLRSESAYKQSKFEIGFHASI
ncbi:AAA family ATPase [Pseudoalteromonas sp. SG44-1]|uniref:AAA family ATPase n=1 Tax=Pseudoalteromonas sp. SG44-1 TaxID=2760964 RepID=UPI001600F26F|nr:AAA family ATPase [Pseudoalteromonas sp. SG44-1]MBB1417233.1 AAA family ATPase [Pseudoalteromonas sp. SG44-1]